MPSKVAVITGAASGIGLALTRDLISKGWNVAMGDINEAAGNSLTAELGGGVRFSRTDVSDWDQLAALFKLAWTTWGRIDFHAANAGIDDRESLYGPTAASDGGEPSKPDLSTVHVDLFSVLYGVRLSLHYFRKNTVPGGKIVVTGSSAGLYPLPPIPQYTACKPCSRCFEATSGTWAVCWELCAAEMRSLTWRRR